MKEGESKEGSSHFDEKTLNLFGHYVIMFSACIKKFFKTSRPENLVHLIFNTSNSNR